LNERWQQHGVPAPGGGDWIGMTNDSVQRRAAKRAVGL